MKKAMIFLLAALMLLCLTTAGAEEAAVPPPTLTATPTPMPPEAPAAATPSPTPVPDMLAQPDATRAPITTATPRPTDAPLPEDPFMANAVEIARRIDLLAKSEVFLDYCDSTYSTLEEVQAVSWGDHTWPARVYEVSGEELVSAMTGGVADAAWLDMSRAEIRRDLVDTLPEMLLYDVEEAVADRISLLARMKVFASDRPEGCGFLVMLYADAAPIVLPWYSEEGAVKLSAFFMPDEKLAACVTAEEVSAWFAEKGLPPAAFEEVTW